MSIDWSALYAWARPEIIPSTAGVFIAFVYLGARGTGIPWIGGKLAGDSGVVDLPSSLRLLFGLATAFPIYALAVFILCSWFYGAANEKQFFMSSLAAMQVFVGRGIFIK